MYVSIWWKILQGSNERANICWRWTVSFQPRSALNRSSTRARSHLTEMLWCHESEVTVAHAGEQWFKRHPLQPKTRTASSRLVAKSCTGWLSTNQKMCLLLPHWLPCVVELDLSSWQWEGNWQSWESKNNGNVPFHDSKSWQILWSLKISPASYGLQEHQSI